MSQAMQRMDVRDGEGIRSGRTWRTVACVACGWLALAWSSAAATRTWTNTASGSWETAGNWNPNGAPTNTDDISITTPGSYTVNINDTTANTGDTSTWMKVNSVLVDAAGTPTLFVDYTNAASPFITGSTSLGTYGSGALVLGNGQYTDTSGISVGFFGQGLLIVSNGLLTTPTITVAGNTGGQGTFDMFGGTVNVTGVNNPFSIGHQNGAYGSAIGNMLLDGGLLLVTNAQTYVGFYGTGNLTISNGTFVTKQLIAGSQAGSTGTVTVAGGSLIATNLASTIGQNGLGRLQVSGGSVNLVGLTVGATGAGSADVSGGTISLGSLSVGGTWNQTGGTVSSAGGTILNSSGAGSMVIAGGQYTESNSMYVGYVSGTGSLTLSNGLLSTPVLLVGYNVGSQGSYSQFGGTNNVTAPGSSNPFSIGHIAGAAGTVLVDGGLMLVTNAQTLVGFSGTGSLTVSNGTFQSQKLIVAANGGSTGSVAVAGGSLIATNATSAIGQNGVGRLSVSGGQLSLAALGVGAIGNSGVTVSGGSVNLGSLGLAGSWNQTGGTVINAGGTTIDSASSATMVIAGGQYTDNSGISVGYVGGGSLVLSNGSILTPLLHVGDNVGGRGSYSQFGGTNNVTGPGTSNPFSVGHGAGSQGSVLVGGGLLMVTNAQSFIGFMGSGSLTVSNGTFIAKQLQVASQTGSTGRVDITSGGVLELRDPAALYLYNGNAAVTNENGGTIRFTSNNPGIPIYNSNPKVVTENATIEFKDVDNANLAGDIASQITYLGDNTLSLYNATNALVASATFQSGSNFSTLRLINGNSRWQGTSLTVGSGGRLLVSNANASASGTITDLGAIRVVNSRMTFEGNMVIGGQYQSDPSTNTFQGDVTVAPGGSLAGSPGDLFDFKRSLFISNTVNNSGAFNLASSTVSFSGGGLHTNAITGHDLGNDGSIGFPDGFTAANDSYGRLTLGSTNDHLYFASGESSPTSNALYVSWLDLAAFTNDFASVSNMVASLLFAAPDVNIYYLDSGHSPGDDYLLNQVYQLGNGLGGNGGFLMPAVPEPASLSLLWTAGVLLLRRRRR